jgi:hypothetical protein
MDQEKSRSTPWWKDRSVAYAIGFRVMMLWVTGFVALLGYGMIREWVANPKADGDAMIRFVVDSFLGCAGAGFALSLGFGIPLGIVNVLSQRERQLELEQQLDSRPSPHDEGR